MIKRFSEILWRNWIWIPVLILLSRSVLGAIQPLGDPSEGRYANIIQEMAISGNWITPQIRIENGDLVPFMGKPPMYFWLGALSAKAFGINEFSVRFPSLVSSAILLFLMFFVLRRYIGEEVAKLSVLLTSTCLGFYLFSAFCLVDMLLAVFVAGAILAYFAFSMETDRKIRWRWSLLVFVLLGGGFLTKGPVAIALFGMPIFVWTWWRRRWVDLKDHAWISGGALFLLITIPWFVMFERAVPGSSRYFFINENILRFTTHDYGDLYGSGRLLPRGTAFPLLLLLVLPWTLLVPFVIVKIWKQGLKHEIWNLQNGFFLLSFALGTIFWCLSRQMLITYLLAMVPMFSIWLALLLKLRQISPERIIPPVVVSFIVGTIALFSGWFIGEHFYGKSTKHALILAQEEIDRSKAGSEIIFTGKIPFTGYFYGRSRIQLHGHETDNQSVQRGLELGKTAVFLIKDKDIKDISPELLQQVRKIGNCGIWGVYTSDLKK